MTGVPDLLVVVFTLVVFAGLLALVTDTYVEVVLAATLLAALWHVVGVFGPNLLLAVGLLTIAGLFRVAVTVFDALVGGTETGSQPVASFLDSLVGGRDEADHERDPPFRRQ